MVEALCFRCDWRGAVDDDRCPACGTQALGVADAEPRRHGPPQARVHRAQAVERADQEATEPEPPPSARGRGRRVAPLRIAALAVALGLAAVASVELGLAGGAERDEPPAHGSGTLVYLARSEEGEASLWLVDLGAGSARLGPRVPDTTLRLVDLSDASPGWLGLEHRTSAGRLAVSVLDGLDPAATLRRVGRGDLVAWGPDGSTVVIARNGRRGDDGCAPVRIELVTLATGKAGWALRDPGFCGPVLSLSRSSAATYFSAASGDRMGVYLTGSVGVPHLMFEGLAMVSAAPPSAFLLAPPGPRGAERALGATGGALLGWKGLGGPVAIASGGEPLLVGRVLAWSPDGGRAALVGTLGEREGVFVLEAGSGSGSRPPRYVLPVAERLDAAFDRRGDLYVVAGGRAFVVRGRTAVPLALPEGTPAPVGPLVWLD